MKNTNDQIFNNEPQPPSGRPTPNRLSIDNSVSIFERESIFLQRNIYQFKVILLGDIAVGKTAILHRYVDNNYISDHRCNVGVEFKTKIISIDDQTGADLKIWDTCGEEKYRTVTRQYYRDAHGIILIFDLTSRNSFDQLSSWIKEVMDYGTDDVSIVLIGNKNDVVNERCVTVNEANKFAEQNKIPYIEVSAKTGNNVVLLFENLTKILVTKEQDKNKKKKSKEKNEQNEISHHSVRLDKSNVSQAKSGQNRKKCCE